MAGDGTVSAGGYRELDGGWLVLDVPSREAALHWAARVAAACRCRQEVREFQEDPLA